MRKVILDSFERSEARLSLIPEHTPIFARQGGRLVGMVVKEKEGWILKIGGDWGAHGYSETRDECLQRANDYSFYIED